MKQEISTREWDPNKEIVRGNSEEARNINNYIEDVRFGLKKKYRMLVDKQMLISADAVKNAYMGNHAMQKSGRTIGELLKYHTKIAKDTLEKGTLKNYGATDKYIKNFIKLKFKEDDISLTQLDYEFMTELEHFIRHNPIKAHDPCEGNGVMKHLERLKKMMKWAKKLGWISSNPYQLRLCHVHACALRCEGASMQILHSGQIIFSDDHATDKCQRQTGTCSKRIEKLRVCVTYENYFKKNLRLGGYTMLKIN